MGPIGCSETSIRNYHNSLGNSPEERGCLLLRGGSAKSRIATASCFVGKRGQSNSNLRLPKYGHRRKICKLMTFERKIMRKIFGPTRTDDGYWRIETDQEMKGIL